jgi:hypothetical protein
VDAGAVTRSNTKAKNGGVDNPSVALHSECDVVVVGGSLDLDAKSDTDEKQIVELLCVHDDSADRMNNPFGLRLHFRLRLRQRTVIPG